MQAEPAMIDAGIGIVRDEIFPSVSEMDDCVGMSMLVNRDTGRCIATTAWRTEEAMGQTAEKVRPLRDRAEQGTGASGSEVHQWEVAVVHRDHNAPEGACARLTWLSADPMDPERVIEVFKMGVLPRFQAADGFCSASLMIDRAGGRWVGTMVFESREAMEATRNDARSIRERVANELEASVDNVEEMEMAFAHLHVPEMA
jgi:hypothetical protein